MKKLLQLTLVSTMLGALMAGCGNAAQNKPAEAGNQPQQTAEQNGSDVNKEPVTLKVLMWNNGDEKATWDLLGEAFTKEHPHIKIVNEFIDGVQFQQIVKARLAGGEGPDIYGVRPNEMNSLIKGGYLSELQDQEWFKQLLPEAQKAFMVDGSAYAFPPMQNANGVMYNKTIFNEYNIAEPQTFDELVAASKTLKDNGIIPIGMSGKDSWWMQFLLFYATAEHVYAKEPDLNSKIMEGESTFSESAAWKDSMNVYKTLLDEGAFVPQPLGVGYDQINSLFIQGKVAMYPATWILADARKENMDIGYFNFPSTNDTNSGYLWGGYSFALGVNPENGHREEANLFLQFVMENENYIKLLDAYKSFPVKDGVDVSGLDPLFPDLVEKWKGKTIVGSPSDGWLPGIQDEMLTAMQDLTGGRISVDEVLKRMDAATEKAIKNKK